MMSGPGMRSGWSSWIKARQLPEISNWALAWVDSTAAEEQTKKTPMNLEWLAGLIDTPRHSADE